MSNNTSTIEQWLASKLEPAAIEKELIAKGFEASVISEHLKEYKRLKDTKRRFTGFICMALGAFLGFISCVLTLINPVPELYHIILYGLTSLAILIICLGMYFVFE
jgi:hypothetical protein